MDYEILPLQVLRHVNFIVGLLVPVFSALTKFFPVVEEFKGCSLKRENTWNPMACIDGILGKFIGFTGYVYQPNLVLVLFFLIVSSFIVTVYMIGKKATLIHTCYNSAFIMPITAILFIIDMLTKSHLSGSIITYKYILVEFILQFIITVICFYTLQDKVKTFKDVTDNELVKNMADRFMFRRVPSVLLMVINSLLCVTFMWYFDNNEVWVICCRVVCVVVVYYNMMKLRHCVFHYLYNSIDSSYVIALLSLSQHVKQFRRVTDNLHVYEENVATATVLHNRFENSSGPRFVIVKGNPKPGLDVNHVLFYAMYWENDEYMKQYHLSTYISNVSIHNNRVYYDITKKKKDEHMFPYMFPQPGVINHDRVRVFAMDPNQVTATDTPDTIVTNILKNGLCEMNVHAFFMAVVLDVNDEVYKKIQNGRTAFN